MILITASAKKIGPEEHWGRYKDHKLLVEQKSRGLACLIMPILANIRVLHEADGDYNLARMARASYAWIRGHSQLWVHLAKLVMCNKSSQIGWKFLKL